MLPSLRLRMLAGFGLVITISLLFAGIGSVWLLRDQQAEAAEQRIGRLVPPLSRYVFDMEQFGWPRDRIRVELAGYAGYYDVRILLVDRDGRVLLDTDERQGMLGQTLDIAARPEGGEGQEMQPFHTVRAHAQGVDMYLFTSALPPLMLPSNIAVREPETVLVLAVPAADITAAWARLLPRFAIAGGMAALVAVVVGTLLAARITRPLAAMTRASEAMAQGDYDQRIAVRGNDEVAQLAAAFNQMASQVARSNRAMRNLLADVSHELRTPLTSIQGFSQALADGVAGDLEEQAELARVVHDEAERMRALVDELLYLSRIESGELALAVDEVDFDALVSATARRMRFRAQEAGVTIRERVDGGTLRGDGRRLEQVLTNLLDNAIRFAPAGSEVGMRSFGDGDEVVVEVRNGGEPIPEDGLPHVFDRFYQADPARSGNGHSGLGLAIASELVQAHGGLVSVESTREGGTIFTVRLPRAGPAAGAAAREEDSQ